ncbi:hypothetical protein ACFCW6_00545 [Streptomyces sp. NPDC056333]|uniref:hypothetical protein n=1 Tax=Streptomyces sp. NPDC056333 TaxID=3345786 RepID=UPI0035DFF981
MIAPEALAFADGAVRAPRTPGPGIEPDRDALARLHEQYLTCGLRNRDDTGYMPRLQRLHPECRLRSPRR